MGTAFERQPIAIIPAAAPSPATDEVAKILAVLDAALAAHRTLKPLLGALGGYPSCGRYVAFHAADHQHAEYTLLLWASAKQLVAKPHISKYEDGTQIRALDVLDGGDCVVSLQWRREPQPADESLAPVTAAVVSEALRPWRPSEGHWTSDHTTSLDAAEVTTKEAP